jgi:hypothetical protein
MPFYCRLVCSLLMALLLAGCCANDACDCNDARADALYLRFRVAADSVGTAATSFGRQELDTVAVLRYPLPVGIAPKAPRDSVTLVRPRAQVTDDLVLDNNAPFPAGTGRKLNSFEYRVLLVRANRAGRVRVTHEYVVRNIDLSGQLEGDGCCTCYRNTHKSATVNGVVYDVTEVGRQRVPIVLGKR